MTDFLAGLTVPIIAMLLLGYVWAYKTWRWIRKHNMDETEQPKNWPYLIWLTIFWFSTSIFLTWLVGENNLWLHLTGMLTGTLIIQYTWWRIKNRFHITVSKEGEPHAILTLGNVRLLEDE